MKVEDLVRNIPMKRWLLASQRLNATSEEITSDGLLAMIVAACEKAGLESGNFDQYTRFLDFTISELAEYLEPDDDEADKSSE